MDRKELGRRLRMARKAHGWSQEEVALAVGMSRPTISQIENDQVNIGLEDLGKFAQLYGKSMSDFLVQDQPEENLLVRFRALAITEDDEVILERGFERCRQYSELEQMLGIPEHEPPRYQVGAPRSIAEAVRAGEVYARNFRNHIDCALADLAEMLEEEGVRVISQPFGLVQGAFAEVPEAGPCIFVKAGEPLCVQNFTLAHELAHALFDWQRGVTADVDFFASRQDPVETRANVFAANLLMPAESVVEWLGRRGVENPRKHHYTVLDVVGLAEAFCVSHLVVVYRLKDLGFVGKEARAELAEGAWRALPEWMRRPREDGGVRHTRIAQLAVRAYLKGLISEGALGQYLDMDPVEAKEFVDRVVGNRSTR